ncbi:MAG: TRAP transporter small permease [Polyangiaceae bacterium]|nr:TRAP transporter small permease [Candidatus Odyssella sp.]NUQ77281.1 TRAP transporter small permease [Polyangiaceae bacterium]
MREGLRAADAIVDGLITACGLLAAVIVAALAGCVALEVVMRYFFGAPTRWVIEFSEYAMLWLAFLSGAWVLRAEGHVRVEMLTEALAPRWQRRAHVVTSWVGAGVCAVLCWVTTAYVLRIRETGEILFKSVPVEKWAIMAVMPPGLALLAIQFVRRAFRPPPAAGTGAA